MPVSLRRRRPAARRTSLAALGAAAAAVVLISTGGPGALAEAASTSGSTAAATTATSALATAGNAPTVQVLGVRADLVSGGEALVQVSYPAGTSPSQAKYYLDGQPLNGVIALRPNGQYQGLLTGLDVGKNVLSVTVPGGASQLTITNHPASGPLFAGAQQQPWICATTTSKPVAVTVPGTDLSGIANTKVSGLASDPVDASCDAQTQYSYYYEPVEKQGTSCTFTITGAAPCFVAFPSLHDASSRPANSAIADFTNDRGQSVKAILQVEDGALDRGQYRLAVIKDPATPSSPWAVAPGWNQKIVWINGGSTGQTRFQAPSTTSAFNDDALRLGFMVAVSEFTDHGTSSNITLGAEMMTMVKQRVTDEYGPIRYTIGSGCSGGSQIQTATSGAYPGLFDGLMLSCSFPDSASVETEVQDCALLAQYYYPSATGSVLTTDEKTAINGNIPGFCQGYLGFSPLVGDPTRAASCGSGFPASITYDPTLRPNGVRCDELDANSPQVGTFVDSDGATKGNRQLDNVGVQYGLGAVRSGALSVEHFLDLNAGIGGFSNDYVWTPGVREKATTDANGLKTWYQAGLVSDGKVLAQTPMIDMRGQNPVAGNVHENWRAWQTRARLDKANGQHGNQVIWAYNGNGGNTPTGAIAHMALVTMDAWLANIEKDTSAATRAAKVLADKPAAATDMCFTTDGTTLPLTDVGLETDACPVKHFGTPRQVAGESITRSVFKCQLKPIDYGDYGTTAFTDTQKAQLAAIFPDGVCDWSKAGVGEVPAQVWMSFNLPGGPQPLGAAPTSSFTAMDRGTLVAGSASKVTGKPKVGHKLKLVTGTVLGYDGAVPATTSVRWLANGKAIKGATGSKLVLTRKQFRKKITVEVTFSAPSYSDLTSVVTVGKVKKARRHR